jgi:hypothetical protein
MLSHHGVFALALAELHKQRLVLSDVAVQRRDEAAGDRAHQRCGWERLPAVFAKEMYNHLLALQPRHIDIEIHPVDAFNRKHHMII